MMIWYAAVAAVMTPAEGARLMLDTARLLFDVTEAKKNREERRQAARTDERILELERQVTELSKARKAQR